MPTMKIGEKIIGKNNPPLMIAEEGQANQGDFDLALKMIKIAADSGADGIEFQFFLANDMYIYNDPGYEIYKSRELYETQITDLIKNCHSNGLICQVAGFSPKIIEICANSGADIFSINATDLNNPFIIDAVISTEKPFWLATLMGTMEEIDWAVNYVSSRSKADFGILHGQHVMSSQLYKGVPAELLQLECIKLFKDRYNLVVGFVDHTDTKFVPSLAVAHGANAVTKHLAPKTDWVGPDSDICLDPDSWKESKKMFDFSIKSMGKSKEISQAEFSDRSIHRRSVYTIKPLKAGHILSSEDLSALRPGINGIDPRDILNIVGKKLLHDLPVQHQLSNNDFI
jgi:sialic acid synthase SpsE